MPLTQLTSTLATEEQKILACIHCGLCLEACPTYVATGDENDGPRGRIYLMRAVGEGRLASNSSSFESHIDRCLGCRACESVCPAGVEYGQLLEASRAELFVSTTKGSWGYKFLRFVLTHVWLHPARLRFAFALARISRDLKVPKILRKSGVAKLVSRQFEFALALLESSAGSEKSDRATTPAESQQESLALLFKGCVGEGLFSRVNRATVRVLQANGYRVENPTTQVCCGALHAHAGDLDGARTLARRNIEAFGEDSAAPIITNAGGCGAMLTTYGHLLSEDESFRERAESFSSRVRDVSQLLVDRTIVKGAAPQSSAVTYDISCHLLHGQHAGDASLAALRSIPDLNFVALKDSDRCCGGAGIYNLLEPELSGKVLQEKLEHIKASGAETVATGNPGCQMQIAAGALLAGCSIKVCHPVELLDESYQRAGLYQED